MDVKLRVRETSGAISTDLPGVCSVAVLPTALKRLGCQRFARVPLLFLRHSTRSQSMELTSVDGDKDSTDALHPALGDPVPPTAREEAEVRKRADWRLLPILCLTVGLQYSDKSAVSQMRALTPAVLHADVLVA